MTSPIGATLLTFSILLSACGRPRVEEELKLTLPVPAAVRGLEVVLPNGAMTLRGGRASELVVDAITRRIAADDAALERLRAVDVRPTLLELSEPGRYRLAFPGLPDGVDPTESAILYRGLMTAPDGIETSLETTRGDLSARGFLSPVSMQTSAGDLQFLDMTGFSDGRTERGDCIVTGQRGGLRLRVGSGGVLVFVDQLAAEGIDIETAGPKVTLRLPTDAEFELDARVDEGEGNKESILVGWPVPVEAFRSGHRAVGKIGAGGPMIRIRVSRGTISVVRRKPGN